MDTLTRKSSEIEKHLTPKPLLCPSCGSSDIVEGLVTKEGTRVFCLVCATMGMIRREG